MTPVIAETVVGLATILGVLVTILLRKLSPLVALTLIPLAGALLLGDAARVGGFMLDGIISVSPMAAMFLFAILFFSIMGDAGLFEPAVRAIHRHARNDASRLAIGTAALATISHLDGSGASTFLICIPALLPIYDRLGMDRRALACIVAMAAGVGNMLPWGGPTIRAAAAIDVPVMDLFLPVVPAYISGLAGVFCFSLWIGKGQKLVPASNDPLPVTQDQPEPADGLDWRFWANLATVIGAIGCLLSEALPPAVCFLLALIVALLINFQSLDLQRSAIEKHSSAALSMVAILFAAGSFTGIMRGSGMLEAMALSGGTLMPDGSASHLPAVVAVFAMPLSLFFDPDSFYFGILPVLGEIAQQSGVPATDVGRAAILGQMTTGFPISPMTPATFMLVGLARVDLSDHQRYTFPYLFALSMIMTVVALATGAI